MAELSENIERNATRPRRAGSDSDSLEQHSLKDQIAADRYLAAKRAAKNKRLGLRVIRLEPPNALGE